MLRLILSILLFLFSLLTVFPAPVYFLWYAAILVGEVSWIFICIILVLLVWGFRLNGLQLTATLFLLAALTLYLRPLVLAYRISGTLNDDLTQAFGSPVVPANNEPFALSKLVTNIGGTELPFRVMEYDTNHNLTLDFYPSQIAGTRPCVVVIHGGSWRNGNSQQLSKLNTVLARQGYNVASINYRKVPQFQSPAPLQDLETALTYLHTNAVPLHIDTNNFVLLGRSAGGQIAMMGGYTLQHLGVKGIISYYGPADMIWGYQNPSNPWVYNSCQVLEDYIGGSYTQKPQQYAQVSPIEFVDSNCVPTLMIYGQTDVLVAYHHSTRLAKKLEQYHVPHYLLTLPWATHGCDGTLAGPSGQLATYSVLGFLQRICK